MPEQHLTTGTALLRGHTRGQLRGHPGLSHRAAAPGAAPRRDRSGAPCPAGQVTARPVARGTKGRAATGNESRRAPPGAAQRDGTALRSPALGRKGGRESGGRRRGNPDRTHLAPRVAPHPRPPPLRTFKGGGRKRRGAAAAAPVPAPQ